MAKKYTPEQWAAMTPEQKKGHNSAVRMINYSNKMRKPGDAKVSQQYKDQAYAAGASGKLNVSKKTYNKLMGAVKLVKAQRAGKKLVKTYKMVNGKKVGTGLKLPSKKTISNKSVSGTPGRTLSTPGRRLVSVKKVGNKTIKRYVVTRSKSGGSSGAKYAPSGRRIIKTRTVQRNGRTVRIHTVSKNPLKSKMARAAHQGKPRGNISKTPYSEGKKKMDLFKQPSKAQNVTRVVSRVLKKK